MRLVLKQKILIVLSYTHANNSRGVWRALRYFLRKFLAVIESFLLAGMMPTNNFGLADAAETETHICSLFNVASRGSCLVRGELPTAISMHGESNSG